MSPSRAAGITLALLCVAPFAYAADHALRIDEAVQLALSRNERAKIAELEITVADAAVEKARAGFLPIIAATATDTVRPYSTPAGQPNNIATSAVNITQPLINAPAWPLYRQAERLLDAQRAASTDAKRILAFDAASSFMQTLSVEAVLKAAQRREDSAKANLADTQARVDAQLNSSNDVTRAHVNLSSSQQEVANDTGNVQKAYLALAYALNAPVAGPLEPPAVTLQAAANPVTNVEALVAIAEVRRPDVIAAMHSFRAAQLFAEEPLLRLVPTLGLTGSFTANSNPAGAARTTDETLGATLGWTIYDAGVRYADKHSRDASASISELQLFALRRGVATDVRTATASLQAAQAAFQVAGQGVEASQRNVEETETLYKHGLAKAIELTDANDSRFEAEVGYVGAEYAMGLAYLALRQAMGLEPLGKDLK